MITDHSVPLSCLFLSISHIRFHKKKEVSNAPQKLPIIINMLYIELTSYLSTIIIGKIFDNIF